MPVDYLAFAVGASALVESQANYQGSSHQQNGFQNGIALPEQLNKVWRQSSMVAAAIATWISQQLNNTSVLDDGNLANLVALLTEAARAGAHKNLVVTYGLAPTFDASQATDFEITLTGNCSPTLVNVVPGQLITIIVREDGVGGHTFTPPANLPMEAIDTTASQVNMQMFKVLSDSTLMALTPLTTKL